MGFSDMGLNETVQPEPVEEGEYTVVIKDAVEVPSKKVQGQDNMRLQCELPEEPMAEAIFHYIPGIGPEDDQTKINNKRRMAVGILEAFGIDHDGGFIPEDLIGASAELIVTQEEYNGKISNKLVIPW